MATTGKSLQELLHYQKITAAVRVPANGVPENILPAQFMSITENAEGRQFSYTELASTRQTAKGVQPGAPSVRRGLESVGERSVTLPRFAEHLKIEGERLMQLRDFENQTRQARGQQWVAYQLAEAGRRFRNTRVAMIYSALANGAVYLQSDGEGGYDLLPTSSGADITLDLNVPANNQGSLNSLLTDWSATSTGIIDEIQAVLEQAQKTSGLPIRHVFYGPNVRSYILDNDQARQILRTDSAMANSLKQGMIPDGFGDAQLSWHPMQRAFFADADGTNQDFFTGDEVIFTPDPSRDWYVMAEGMEMAPSGSLGVKDAENPLADAQEVVGRGGYAVEETDPYGVKVVGFDNSLPVFKVPSAVFIGDCTN